MLALDSTAGDTGVNGLWAFAVRSGAGDPFIAGIGHDTMTGGDGADVFRYGSPVEGGDLVTDFQTGLDRFELDALTFGFTNGTTVAQGINFAVIGATYADNAVSASEHAAGRAAFILDGDGRLIHDTNGVDPGYTVVATVANNGAPAAVAASDITLTSR
jgi:Ca2+-binding RTX toxin-like protein